jgi:hypothetical protein
MLGGRPLRTGLGRASTDVGIADLTSAGCVARSTQVGTCRQALTTPALNAVNRPLTTSSTATFEYALKFSSQFPG